MKEIAEVDKVTGTMVRIHLREDDWEVPAHKVGTLPSVFLPVVREPAPAYDSETQALRSINHLDGDRWLFSFEAVAKPVPSEVPRWAFRAVVSLAGLTPSIESALSQLPEPAKTVAREQWGGVGVIRRAHPTVVQLMAALGVTDKQADALFESAAKLVEAQGVGE